MVHPRVIAYAIPLALSVLAASCSDAPDADPAHAAIVLADNVRALSDAASGGTSISNGLEENLPNVRFQPPDGEAFNSVVAVVAGDVADVEDGLAQHWTEERPGSRTDFDDPTADSRTFHVVLDNVEHLSGDPARDPVRLGIAVGGSDDPALLREGLRNLGRVVLLLNDGGPAFDYDETLYTTGADGIITVGEDGRLELPLMEPELVADYQGDIRTLDDLREALAQPDRVIELTGSNGAYQRPRSS